jgi:hypothetical protein
LQQLHLCQPSLKFPPCRPRKIIGDNVHRSRDGPNCHHSRHRSRHHSHRSRHGNNLDSRSKGLLQTPALPRPQGPERNRRVEQERKLLAERAHTLAAQERKRPAELEHKSLAAAAAGVAIQWIHQNGRQPWPIDSMPAQFRLPLNQVRLLFSYL